MDSPVREKNGRPGFSLSLSLNRQEWEIPSKQSRAQAASWLAHLLQDDTFPRSEQGTAVRPQRLAAVSSAVDLQSNGNTSKDLSVSAALDCRSPTPPFGGAGIRDPAGVATYKPLTKHRGVMSAVRAGQRLLRCKGRAQTMGKPLAHGS